MAISPIQRRYLEAMGISLWQRRQPLPVTDSTTAEFYGSEPAFMEAPVPEAETAQGDSRKNHPSLPSPLPPGGEGIAAAEGEEQDRLAEAPPSASPTATRMQRIAAMDWETLQAAVRTCTACALHAGRTQAVFGVGNPQAEWMIIGEAPGADEDRLGEPFVGRAGKLLDAMLLALGLQRDKVFIANILKCRPPNNRDPSFEEAHCCRPFLERQIALIKPKIILAVGRIAAQNLLQTETPIGKLRGRVYRLRPADIPLVVSYHPAYLLRSPREKRKSWEDLQLARRILTEELQRDGAGETS